MVRFVVATTGCLLGALTVGCSPGEHERGGPSATSTVGPGVASNTASNTASVSSAASNTSSTPQPVPAGAAFDDAKYVHDNGFDRCAQGGLCALVATHDQCSLIPVAQEHTEKVVAEIQRVGHPRCFGPKVRGTASCVNGRCVAQLTTEGVPD